MELSLNQILVLPRQREAKIDELFVNSVRKKLIHPIVLRKTENGPTLVVGARRLLALKEIGTDPLIEGEHFQFFHNLSSDDAEIIELEENVKRAPMPWREHVKTIVKIHRLLMKQNPDWTKTKSAQELSISIQMLNRHISIDKQIDSPLLANARDAKHAYSILQVASNRAASDVVNKITEIGKKAFEKPSEPKEKIQPKEEEIKSETKSEASKEIQEAPEKPLTQPDLILCIDFKSWLETYSGPKFNLIHCDFPYNVNYKSYGSSTSSTSDDYDTSSFMELLELFCLNLDKFCSYQAHVVFWFSMEFYEQTRTRLETAGLSVQRHPLIWFKSDNSGIIPGRDNQYPRRVYETALLCVRGQRSLIKSLANLYSAPGPTNSIHPSQKSEPMLKHFFSMLIDQNTDVFDPTCGSGAAIRAAESLGARNILGLELDPDYTKRANLATSQARSMRKIQL